MSEIVENCITKNCVSIDSITRYESSTSGSSHLYLRVPLLDLELSLKLPFTSGKING